ncbi:hypothetical protein [Corynebacterium heidelbergense]|uniref:Secreted protein n=1 Tax=Corynebacterium heidelbergense TaxID=2055947 RepID=A0A364V5M3_9CORY|nr:hypothetical protein [Corynebacterium heidelbergense]RAV31919.1 hypothetical protein DLJ54_05880 [Corynebacterium heidelbergense]RAV33967.1 hypothetical protein CWC39_05725 [Corynebacterium heidelbergense]WCZ36298.1 hypothetical protein CHEID_03725 [Corynebacterium heidelbergense]
MKTRTRIATAGAAAAATIALTGGMASAATPTPQQVASGNFSVQGVDVAAALPGWDINNAQSQAAARDAIALAVSAQGGKVDVNAGSFSGPAGIAIGDGAVVNAQGVKPGLAIGIAGPGTTVNISGTAPVKCEGNAAFAGDFQTLTGCVIYQTPQGPVSIPLSVLPR